MALNEAICLCATYLLIAEVVGQYFHIVLGWGPIILWLWSWSHSSQSHWQRSFPHRQCLPVPNIPQHLFMNSFEKTFKYVGGTDAFLLSELVESELKFVPNHISSAEAILCMHQMFCTSAFPFSASFYNSPRLLFWGAGLGWWGQIVLLADAYHNCS